MVNLEIERMRRRIRAIEGREPDPEETERCVLTIHGAFINQYAHGADIEELVRAYHAIGAALEALGAEGVSARSRLH